MSARRINISRARFCFLPVWLNESSSDVEAVQFTLIEYESNADAIDECAITDCGMERYWEEFHAGISRDGQD